MGRGSHLRNRRSHYRGQGTFEYVLLLGGVLLIVVLALVVLQGTFQQSATGVSDVQLKQCKLSAQQAPSCFNAGGAFNGSKTFSMLGYQANPLLCNCSDYNPDAFTVSVGQQPLSRSDFSTLNSNPSFSSELFFDSTPSSKSFAVCFPLKTGTYQFFLVTLDNQVTGIQPDAVASAGDGKSKYCFNEYPAGSRIKINPLGKITRADQDAVIAGKDESSSASDLESQAGSTSIEKKVDSDSVLRLLPGTDRLRATFRYTPVEDSSDGFTVAIPISADKIEKTWPESAEIKPDSTNPDVTILAWDNVKLTKGKSFSIIVVLKPENKDAKSISDEVDQKTGKVQGKTGVKKTSKHCPKLGPFEIPVGCTVSTPAPSPSASPSPSPTATVSNSPAVSASTIPSASPTLSSSVSASPEAVSPSVSVSVSPPVSISPSVSVSVSPSASPSPAGSCVSTGKPCLPLLVDKCCSSTQTCRNPDEGLDRLLKFQCLPLAATTTPSPSPSPSPQASASASPSPSPSVSPSPTDEPSPLPDDDKVLDANPVVNLKAGACVESGAVCTSIGGTNCCSGLSCRPAESSTSESPVNRCLPVEKNPWDCLTTDTSCELGGFPSCCGGLACIPSKTDPNAGNACQKPSSDSGSSTPTPEPADLSKVPNKDNAPWSFQKLLPSDASGSANSEVSFVGAKTVNEFVKTGDLNDRCDPSSVNFCSTALSCVRLAPALHTCQNPPTEAANPESDAPSVTQLLTSSSSTSGTSGSTSGSASSATSTPTPSTAPADAFHYSLYPSIDLNSMSDQVNAKVDGAFGPSQPIDYVTDKDGNVYAILSSMVKQVVKDQPYSSYWDNDHQTFNFNFISAAVSKNHGRSWSFLDVQGEIPKAQDQKTLRIDTFNPTRRKAREDQCKTDYDACYSGMMPNCLKYSEHPETCPSGISARCNDAKNTCMNNADYSVTAELRETESVNSKYLGSAPAPDSGVYVFYSVFHKRYRTDYFKNSDYYNNYFAPECIGSNEDYLPDCAAVFSYGGPSRVLSSQYDVRAMHLTKDGKTEDVLVNKKLDLPDRYLHPDSYYYSHINNGPYFPNSDERNVKFLGFANDKYYFCTEEQFSDSECAASEEPTLFETDKLGTPLKKIGVFGYPVAQQGSWKNQFYMPFSKLFVDPNDEIYAYDGINSEWLSFGPQYKGTGDYGVYALKDGSFVKTVAPLFTGLTAQQQNLVWYPSNYVGSFGPTYAFDGDGNLHLTYSLEDSNTPNAGSVYYRIIPQNKMNGTDATSYAVHIFGSTDCTNCAGLKTFLAQSSIAYAENDLDALPDNIQGTVQNARKDSPTDAVVALVHSPTNFRVLTGFNKAVLTGLLGILKDAAKLADTTNPSTSTDIQYTIPAHFDWMTGKQVDASKGTYTQTTYGPVLNPTVFIQSDETPAILVQDGAALMKYAPNGNDWKTSMLIDSIKSQTVDQSSQHAPSQVGMPFGEPIHDEREAVVYYASGHTSPACNPYCFQPIQYNFYYLGKKADSDEPLAGNVLSELLPYQKFTIPLSLTSDSPPEISSKSTSADIVSTAVEVSKDRPNEWNLKMTVDARNSFKGGVLQLQGDKLSSIFEATGSDGNPVDVPVDVLVDHIPPESLAYATPQQIMFYTSNHHSVSHPIYLINNYPRPLTFSCGSLFTQVVAGNSIGKADFNPPASRTLCPLTLNGVATRENILVDSREAYHATPPKQKDGDMAFLETVVDDSLAKEDLFVPPAKTQDVPATFRDCSDGYCNCGQAKQALTSFKNLVLWHAYRIDAQTQGGSILDLYPDGYSEKVVLRTGVFDDLDQNRLAACEINFDGWTAPLQPGMVYQFSMKVPLTGKWLDLSNAYPDGKETLLPQWSISTPNGAGADKTNFARLVEVR